MKYKDKYVQEKYAKEYAQQSFENIRKQNVELLEQVERLQEQINEANHILKDVFISDAYYKSKQAQYLKNWGVK